ncbi:MAG TPA: TIM barrel protein, partial [Streptosporangiales bacterium]
MPTAKGLASALGYAAAVGAEAVQVFLTNPRGWAPSPGRPEADRLFRDRMGELGVPVFVHSPYLVNVGSPDEATLRNSLAAIRHSLRRGADVGARGVVVHTGS